MTISILPSPVSDSCLCQTLFSSARGEVGLWLQHFLRLQLPPNCSGRDVFRS